MILVVSSMCSIDTLMEYRSKFSFRSCATVEKNPPFGPASIVTDVGGLIFQNAIPTAQIISTGKMK